MNVKQATLEMVTPAIMPVQTVDPTLCVKTMNVSVSEDIEKEREFVSVSFSQSSQSLLPST